MTNRSWPDDDQVHLVTSAREGHSQEIRGRTRRYLISMGIRTVCLVLAIFVLHGWLRLLGIVIALVLPWFAVVMANAGPVPDEEEPEFIDPNHREIAAPTDITAAAGDLKSVGHRPHTN